MAAFGLFTLAGITDALDGQLAKSLNSSTKFGKVLDPVADKALMTAGLLALAFIGDVPVWFATLVIGRDVLIGVGIGICLLRGVKVDIVEMPTNGFEAGVQTRWASGERPDVLVNPDVWPRLGQR